MAAGLGIPHRCLSMHTKTGFQGSNRASGTPRSGIYITPASQRPHPLSRHPQPRPHTALMVALASGTPCPGINTLDVPTSRYPNILYIQSPASHRPHALSRQSLPKPHTAPPAAAASPRSQVPATAEDQQLHDKPSFLRVEGVGLKAPGSPSWLLKDVSMDLPRGSLGVIYGRSGSGKTTLLQVLSGLASATAGTISMATGTEAEDRRPNTSTGTSTGTCTSTGTAPGGGVSGASTVANRQGQEQGQEQVKQEKQRQHPGLHPMSRAQLAEKAGIVFQFPERYFLADSLLAELTFGWPRKMEDMPLRLNLAARLQTALVAVGLRVPLDTNPRVLSGGNQRRLALAIQLVRLPDLILLDEPLAGLDWSAREDVVALLADLKQRRTLIVVSHDLMELAPLVDKSWCMHMGGRLEERPLPTNLTINDDESDYSYA